MRQSRISLLPSLGLIFSLGTIALAAEPPAPSQPQPPVYRTHARDVVVDVVVTKSGDEPVAGLRAPDFQVLEDGQPQALDFFEEHTAKTLPPGALQPLPKMPPGVYTNVPPAPQSDSVNVLLLDALNTDQPEQSYVRTNILKFLKTMTPGTRAAIFTLTSQLRMVQGFTSDSSELVKALNDPKFGDMITKPMESRSMQNKKDDTFHIATMIMMNNGYRTAGVDAIVAFQQDFAAVQAGQRVGMSLEALQILARYLSGVPGRKNLIWFSSSFPVTVFPRAGQNERPNQMNTSNLRDYGKAIRETADMLTVSKVAVYPIGAEGVMSEHIADPDLQSYKPGPVDYESGEPGQGKGGNMDAYFHEAAARSDKIMAMEQLAADTGGKAYYNVNDLNTAMQHAIADGSHYYTLVYSPSNKKMDGSYRRIEIKIPTGKYKLSYRRGYNADEFPPSDAAPQSNPLQPLMMRGMPESTQILYAARVIPAVPQPTPTAPRAGKNPKLTGPVKRYSVDFMIRWTDVKLDTAPDGKHSGKIQVELLAYDREGNALNWAGGTQAMSLDPVLFANIQRSGVPAHFEIDLPADQDVFLETGVYDWQTGKAGTLEVALPAEPGRIKVAAHDPPGESAKPN